MVELVVFLHEFVDVVGYERGREVAAGFGNNGWEVGEALHEGYFLLIRHNSRIVSDVHSCFRRAAQHAPYAGIGVLYERTCVAVEVDAFLGVECHVFAGVDFEQEIFEGSESYHFGYGVDFLCGESVGLAEFRAHFLCVGHHVGHEVVGIYYGALAAFHLAVG